jgi:UDPglucose 6-dehydrogenase
MKIAVIGLGYIGLANAVLLAPYNDVEAADIDKARRDLISSGISPIKDAIIERALVDGGLHLSLSSDAAAACSQADYIIIAVPTDPVSEGGGLDTTIVRREVEAAIAVNPDATIVIRSTLPVGFTEKLSSENPDSVILFVPEFSREGKSLYDCLYPSRIIVGMAGTSEKAAARASQIVRLMLSACRKPDTPVLYMGASEAEAVKLFANTYLAMRISFFNELDSFAQTAGLDAKDIIDGLSLDERIGGHYNNPSFGFGGNCLPKDARQLILDFPDASGTLIRAVSASNAARKKFSSDRIRALLPVGGTLGIYRLTMKTDSDNFRHSAILGVMAELKKYGVPMLIYEPTFGAAEFDCIPVTAQLELFKASCALIAANRCNEDLSDVRVKVYTRDLYERD